jgi:hypothetical protein
MMGAEGRESQPSNATDSAGFSPSLLLPPLPQQLLGYECGCPSDRAS